LLQNVKITKAPHQNCSNILNLRKLHTKCTSKKPDSPPLLTTWCWLWGHQGNQSGGGCGGTTRTTLVVVVGATRTSLVVVIGITTSAIASCNCVAQLFRATVSRNCFAQLCRATVSHNWFAQLFRKCVAQLILRTGSRNSLSISPCNFVVFVMCLLCGPSSFVELLFCLTRSALCMHCRFLRCYFVLVVICFLCGLSSSVKLLVCLTRPALCMHCRLLL